MPANPLVTAWLDWNIAESAGATMPSKTAQRSRRAVALILALATQQSTVEARTELMSTKWRILLVLAVEGLPLAGLRWGAIPTMQALELWSLRLESLEELRI